MKRWLGDNAKHRIEPVWPRYSRRQVVFQWSDIRTSQRFSLWSAPPENIVSRSANSTACTGWPSCAARMPKAALSSTQFASMDGGRRAGGNVWTRRSNNCRAPSAPAVHRRLGSLRQKLVAWAAPKCNVCFSVHAPVPRSLTMSVPSRSVLATERSSGAKAAWTTDLRWPCNDRPTAACGHCQISRFCSSPEPQDAISLLFAETAQWYTPAEWP
mmetsp:Transcript_27197/g.54977  ORF Transcript_27197/g.54977 Transcript_27197/m.54977 type:complete len:214 (+) Transcript_27197:449-1090(+)